MTRITIVSGTYNRLPLLKQMMNSASVQVQGTLTNVDIDFVIADGGSTDGTLDWLQAAKAAGAPITIIEDGELKGAISAFSRGAQVAQGDYVILANDDITFMPHSILRAATYLQDNPGCGMVAFEDNRPPNNESGYSVQGQTVRNALGEYTSTAYAQVGMIRKWLGDAAGWWGFKDEIMSRARTYGGDNYLTARVWEMGYSIRAVDGCRIHDWMAVDDLRKVNNANSDVDSNLYYQRFPKQGAIFGSTPVDAPEAEDVGLRSLYLSLHEGSSQESRLYKRGMRDALAQLGTVVEYDYVARALVGADIAREARLIADALQPHFVYVQVHTATRAHVDMIRQLRARHPNAVVVNWNGDYWPEKAFDKTTIEYLRYVDAALVVNYSFIDQYAEIGIPAFYVQDAAEEPQELPNAPEHDVLFIGNAYNGTRRQLGELLKSLPYNVGLYGNGWGGLEDGQTYYNWPMTHALIANAKIVIGDMQFPDAEAYVSNRFFNTLRAGALHLQQVIPNFEARTGIVDGTHYATWADFEDLPGKIAYYLENSKDRNRIKRNGKRLAEKHHTYTARLKQIFNEILPTLAEREVA